MCPESKTTAAPGANNEFDCVDANQDPCFAPIGNNPINWKNDG
jgi:hypothetical protein